MRLLVPSFLTGAAESASSNAQSAPSMTAEDFSVVLQGIVLQGVAGVRLILGVTPRDRAPVITPANHSPLYDVDEAAMPTGIEALSALALDALLHGVPTLRPVT